MLELRDFGIEWLILNLILFVYKTLYMDMRLIITA